MGIKRKILILLLIFLFFLPESPVLALEISYPSLPGAEPPQIFMEKIKSGEYESDQAFPLYAKYFYQLIVISTGLICFLTVASGGFLHLVAGDSAVKTRESFERISAGFLGAIIILTSYLVLNILDPELLVLFGPEKTSLEVPPFVSIPEPEKEIPNFVEIPLGGLIKETERKSGLVASFAFSLQSIASDINDASQCLNFLTAACDCEQAEVETENCESDNGGCAAGNCEDKDACDIDTPADICDGLGQSIATNLRTSINNVMANLNVLLPQLEQEKQRLLISRRNLEISKQWLKLAEALLRDSYYSAQNFDSFIAIEEKEIKKLFPREMVKEEAPGESGFIEYPQPDGACKGDCIQEITPACALYKADNTLYCYGNNYRCCETDERIKALCDAGPAGLNEVECLDPPPLDQQGSCCIYLGQPGCLSPRQCSSQWFPASDFPEGTLLYNSQTYSVPSGGVYVCGSNVFACCIACGQ